MRKQRMAEANVGSACVVCEMNDARALVSIILAGGQRVTLCGNHAVMHRRCRATLRTVADLKETLGNRRSMDRRGGPCEDELAERLQSAFTRDRRRTERRAS
ncbi:MAG: hypothetical protein KF819_13755 [Labilithrix sp.]|nr:hypothetical protein [Labilithrix sp.]